MKSTTFLSRQERLDTKQVFISCVVPFYNEQTNVATFIHELVKTLRSLTNNFEIIAIDDGSRDETAHCLHSLTSQYHQLKSIIFSRNFGKENALTAGLDHVQGEVAILMDGDFQHPFETFVPFLNYWAKGYDMVYGVRRSRSEESWLKRRFTAFFYQLTKLLSEVKIPANAGDFRLLDHKAILAMKQCRESNRFMKGLYAWVGFKAIGVEFDVQPREHGKSRWTFRKLLSLALHGIFAFTHFPLRVWSLVGLIISSIAFLYALWIIFDVLINGIDLPGFATIVVAVMFFGGIQLLSIGILGEYIGRIFTESKKRPLYIISEKHGFNKDSSAS